MSANKEYKALVKSGDLLEMFPDLDGTWIKDKSQFIKYWEGNQKILGDIDIEFEEY